MKNIVMKIAAAAVLCATTALTPVTANAAELKYASIAPPNSPWAKLIMGLVGNAAKASSGDLAVKPFLGGQLGSEPVVIQQVARGRVDMGGFSLTAAALVVPELGLLNAPYLWDDREQAVCALDNHLIASLKPYFETRGLINLGWGETGYEVVFSKRPLLKASDYEGLKIRVAPAKGAALTFKSFGSNGVVLPAAELNGSLQTGLVDAAEIPTTFGILTGVGQLAPVVNQTNHIYLPSLTVVSVKSFNKLSPENQVALMKSPIPAAIQRKTVRGVEAAMIKRLTDAGGKFLELDPAEIAILREKSVATHEELVAQTGGDAAAVWALIQDAKTACSN